MHGLFRTEDCARALIGGGNCIEVALDWRKSSCSSSSGGEYIEVAACTHTVHVRDSKVPQGPTFAVAPSAWSTFLTWAN
ncbi:DUF397 domain-containing protein [Streptomyces sp. NBC_01591]|uniref:DUF397 domain-containing protein n=1 Tax=Streptomyces sp. NBC_01591 TaxID=2975888 RepID=UPI002DDB3011|nr:DUF397 domain-containing protein [Streptomyces sp. NBC_01591]WSD69322.1 DUF397 domain-containing protein [Streptomyces sp. NBC_01591]